MAIFMKKKLNNNLKKRYIYKEIELNKIIYKTLLTNKKLKKNKHLVFIFKNINTSDTNFKSFCILTGHSRSVYRKFNISRYKLKSYLNKGLLEGFQKYTW